MGEGLVLLAGSVVGGDILPASSSKGVPNNIVTRWEVELSISRGVISPWDLLKDTVNGRLHISRLPAVREGLVKVLRISLPP